MEWKVLLKWPCLRLRLQVFFAIQASDFIVQSGNNIREPFDPYRRPLARMQEHFHGILISKQTLGECAVETLHNSLVLVKFSAPQQMYVLRFSISLVRLSMNSQPRSTCSTCGQVKGLHL